MSKRELWDHGNLRTRAMAEADHWLQHNCTQSVFAKNKYLSLSIVGFNFSFIKEPEVFIQDKCYVVYNSISSRWRN